MEFAKDSRAAFTQLPSEVKLIEAKVFSQSDVSKAFLGKCTTAKAKPFVAKWNQKRFKVLCVAVNGAEVVEQQWNTQCGLRFKLWLFTGHASVGDFPADARCVKCFGSMGWASGRPTWTPSSSSTEESGGE